jgi:serine/threonine protein kinase/Tol biopolymer transport system component
MDPDAIVLFRELADRSSSEREEYYARHQVPAGVRTEVESLLRFDRETVDSFHGWITAAADRVLLGHPLVPGARLGPYELLAPAGAGGMGEVYKARDTRLGRTVAIKVLPPHVARDQDLNQRFEREARMLAALSHPHICPVFDVGHQDDTAFLVMEYLDGERLAERLGHGRLPLDQALRYAIQIADALDKAHGTGIVHRDLKPGNIMLTSSGAKLLDFGLAKPTRPALGTSLSRLPTTPSMTERGTILGTFQYMAPEQLEGAEADARTDIFAFGAVVYEMLTGKKAFEGRNPISVIAAIMHAEPPPIATTQPLAPPLLDHLVRTCLAKDPKDRWQSAADVMRELTWIAASGAPGAAATAQPPRRANLPSIVAAMSILVVTAAVALIVGVVAGRRFFGTTSAPAAQTVQFTIDLPTGESIHEHSSSSIAFSPDGTRLVYAVNRADGRGLYVRSLQNLTPQWLAQGERAASPFFSPDGGWIAFESGGILKRIAVDGGSPIAITDAPYFTGGTWGQGDTIVFVPSFTEGLWKVPANGGRRARLTSLDQAAGERAHLWPDRLPNGNILFSIQHGASVDESRLAVLSVVTGKWKVVLHNGFHGRYAAGHLVFARGNGLFTVPFDAQREEVTGSPRALVDGVAGDRGNSLSLFAVSDQALAYVPGMPRTIPRSLVWVDPKGVQQLVTTTRRSFDAARIAPDGRRLTMWIEESTTDVHVYDLARDAFMRLTFSAHDHGPVWSPDGKRIAFESARAGTHHLFVRAADGSGDDRQITTGENHHYLNDWSPDGKLLLFNEFAPDTGADLWVVDVDGKALPRLFLRTPFVEKQAAFSPNGKWVAYVSNESGLNEVYVRAFPDAGAKVQISVGGGEEPAWSRSGDALYYRTGRRMMAVDITTQPEFTPGRVRVLFEGTFHYNIVPSRTYDVAADGRFVMVGLPDPATSPRQINVKLHPAY